MNMEVPALNVRLEDPEKDITEDTFTVLAPIVMTFVFDPNGD